MELYSHKLMTPILTLNFRERSLLFAELSSIAYSDEKVATKLAKQLGFTTVEFYDKNGAQAYRFQNKYDTVIACRGTQPTQFNDIAADLKAMPVNSDTVGRVHHGFKCEVDELWPMVLEDITRKVNKDNSLWFTGHSLGAAMATVMASRAWYESSIQNPKELYTYGSPRVGWRKFVNTLAVPHHRWKNNNDIVTTVPLWLMGYKHDGVEHYLNTWGNVRKPTRWQKTKDQWRGIWKGILAGKVDSFSDHAIGDYVIHLAKYRDNLETPQL